MSANFKFITFLLVFVVLPFHLFSLENEKYHITVNKDASITLYLKDCKSKPVIFTSAFVVMKSYQDPSLSYMKGGVEGNARVPNWAKPVPDPLRGNQVQESPEAKPSDYYYPGLPYNGPERVTDYFKASNAPIKIKAKGATIIDKSIHWEYTTNNKFTFSATITLPEGLAEPIISYTFTPADNAWYSVGYSGTPEMTLKEADAIWQPLVWQAKRFPTQSILTLEDAAPTPTVLVEKKGLTMGLVAKPSEIPFRFPSLEKNTIKLGVLIRNEKGNVQPMIFSPVLGTNESSLKAGIPYSFKLNILLYKGALVDAHQYIAENIFQFKDYRKNVYCNLNQTITNMTSFVMNDNLANFNSDLRGFDYSTDVLQTVKNVSPLHPLSAAIITDNKDIYVRRAIPMLEFALSREKYLFSQQKNVDGQGASSKMAGPGIEVSELASLYSFFGEKTPLFLSLADSMRYVTKKFNMSTLSKGDSFINLLTLYQANKNKTTLQSAIAKADEYIKGLPKELSEITQGESQFFTDYVPAWMELLYLYEETKEQRFLDAAAYGAKLYIQNIWFYPVIPNENRTINKGNNVDFKGFYSPDKELTMNVMKMKQAEQEVPAWRVSQIGLTPEAANTVTENPAIFLAHYAAHLLRLAHYTHNDFFRSIARSAIVGRYASFPGYDINGVFTTIYEQADYAARPLTEVAYNQIYYNHIFPHIALLYDYLITDVFVKSNENISFPHRFDPGYAYLKSNVYGHASGNFYTDQQVQLWMPAHVLKVDNEQINYLTAYGNDKFYISLLNQSDMDQTVTFQLNPNLIPFNFGKAYKTNVWAENLPIQKQSITDGKLKIQVKAKGITSLAIENISILPKIQADITDQSIGKMGKNSYKIIQSSVGKISSSILCLGKGLSQVYVWMEANPSQLKKVKLEYRFSALNEWKSMEDSNYPYEFRVPLEDSILDIELRVKAEKRTEVVTTIDSWILSKQP